MIIYFYKEHGPLGYLASYSPHSFYKNGVFYKTVEHYYQSKKVTDESIQKKIIDSKTPKEASLIGRDRNSKIRDDWKYIKQRIMFEAVLYKFMFNNEILMKLLETGNDEIVENTTKENYWGCGPNKDGTNYYGKILCQVRDLLRYGIEKGVIYEKVFCNKERT